MTPKNLPRNIAAAITGGLEYVKEKTATDVVATTADVNGPQSLPPGSPLAGQVALSKGAPIEDHITIIVDTTAFPETSEVVAYIGDASEVHETSCNTCSSTENKAAVYLGSPTCDRYPTFLNRLCSTPYTFSALQFRARKVSGTADIALPEQIEWSRQNLNGQGDKGILHISLNENLEAFPRADLKYADLSLDNMANLFDRDTRWRIPGLVGGRRYELKLMTAFRKTN
jgi:hypothetical protein